MYILGPKPNLSSYLYNEDRAKNVGHSPISWCISMPFIPYPAFDDHVTVWKGPKDAFLAHDSFYDIFPNHAHVVQSGKVVEAMISALNDYVKEEI